jgi:hypothetical protein
MYSTGVDYSTLSIYSLHRHDGNTVQLQSHPQAPPAGAHLLPSLPAGATSDMDKAAILLPQTLHPTEGNRPRQRATARRIATIDQALLVTMGAMLVVLTLSLAVVMAKGQLGHEQRQFTAYDCTSPQELKAVTKGEPPQCQDRLDQDPVSQRNQTYLLLQKATYRRQPVSRCKVLRTRVAHHCGDSDHQTFIPQFSTFRDEVTISANKCKEMYRRSTRITGTRRRPSKEE